MKKKFTKQRFYKRFDAQAMENFDLIEWSKCLTEASQAMCEAVLTMSATHSTLRQTLEDINHIKEHGALPARSNEGCVLGDRVKIPSITTGGRILGHDGVIRIVT